jgi:hypothetical protein
MKKSIRRRTKSRSKSRSKSIRNRKVRKTKSLKKSPKRVFQRMQADAGSNWYEQMYREMDNFHDNNYQFLDEKLTCMVPTFMAFTKWLLLYHYPNLDSKINIETVEDDIKKFHLERPFQLSWVIEGYRKCKNAKSRDKEKCITKIYDKLCQEIYDRLSRRHANRAARCLQLLSQRLDQIASNQFVAAANQENNTQSANLSTGLLGRRNSNKGFFGRLFKKK